MISCKHCPARLHEGGQYLVHAPWCPEAVVLPGAAACANVSGLHPIGHAVLVFPHEPEINKSPIIVPETVRKGLAVVEARAVVIEVGPNAWADEKAPRARPGDKVLIGKYSGALAVGPKDEKVYRLVNADDVYCRLED